MTSENYYLYFCQVCQRAHKADECINIFFCSMRKLHAITITRYYFEERNISHIWHWRQIRSIEFRASGVLLFSYLFRLRRTRFFGVCVRKENKQTIVDTL